ncbi:hypothetical protein HTZ97_08245 [Desulfuromonas acetoxidans]|uniref:Uncharacterized protein n=1 Tax=Desulfuromonas acetoxidans (strain DSM 684 / 11070) TaxID=281689 RepID=Q1K0E4_DESA6|nr:hypothetical protein [Desulfuromonas acetoxidans]EAT15997.1 hypothetical protein Dace_2297 [Desulfuromonas acetoxidans DSM 684]MBF0644104.1 hypothetical protein [Desulfuromonas acetoxidans]NVD24597.1 hypothetical protein [Desulfuromonas acetoxidans]NVE16453.1 hypothetical protein [Desulfuromonas acetoxidans]
MQVLSAKGYDVYGMTNRSVSQLSSVTDQSQASSAGSSTVQDSVTLSPQARELAASQATSQVKTAATATFNTNKGDVEMDIEAYFSPKQNSFSGGIDSLPPFLFPTENNINALAKHISSTMPGLMSDYGIPVAPETIQYDTKGQLVLPNDYPYAEEFTQMLDENPSFAREMSTVNALSSHLAGMQRAAEFQEASEGMSDSEIAALMNQYSDLFDGQHSAGDFSLGFSADGSLQVSVNGAQIV